MPAIPDFELIRLIGHGSFGDVWIARNVSGALRAIKVVWRSRFTDAEPYEREFRGLQRFAKISLESARQLALLHVGINAQEGFFYSVMELADDAETGRQIQPERYTPLTLRTLRKQQGRLAVADVVRIGVDLAGALVELHQHGLVHRDIKLSNVILVGGVPKLADIGLVAQDGAQTIQIGTDGYIPPEGPGTVRADLYATGKVLYELATGFDRNDYPSLPPDVGGWEDGERFFDLNAVVERACKEKPEERYKTAADLREDLTLMQAGESVIRLRKAEKRSRRALRATLALVAGLLVMGVLYWRNEMTTRAQRDRLGDSFRQQAIKLANDGDTLGSLPLLLQAVKLHRDGSENWKDDMNQIFISLKQSPNLAILHQFSNSVHSIDFSPDSRQMAVATDDGLLSFWDMENLKLVRTLDPLTLLKTNMQKQSVMSVKYSKDGKKIVASGNKGAVVTWHLDAPDSTVRLLKHPRETGFAVFSPDGSRIATACEDTNIRVWEVVGEPKLLHVITNFDHVAHHVAFSPDGKKLGVAVQGRSAGVISFDGETPKVREIKHPRWVYSVDFSPDGQLMATACGDQEVRLWNPDTEDLVRVFPHSAMVTSAIFSTDGEELITTARDGFLHIWNARRLLGAPKLLPHPENAHWACSSRDARWIAGCGGDNGVLRVWDMKSKAAFGETENWTPYFGMRSWTASPGTNGLLAVPPIETEGRPVTFRPATDIFGYVVDPGKKAYLVCLKHADGVEVLARTPDGKSGRAVISTPVQAVLAAGLNQGCLMYIESATNAVVLDAISGKIKFRESHKNLRYFSGHFHPDGRWATINALTQVLLVDLHAGESLGEIAEPRVDDPYFFTASTFSPDGKILCVGGSSGAAKPCLARIYRILESGPVLDEAVHIGHKDGIRAFSFSSDGHTLVTIGEDRKAIAWDTRTWKQRTSVMSHGGEVDSAFVSPDGRRLMTCSEYRPGSCDVLQLWDLNSGAPVCSRVRASREVAEVGYLDEVHSWAWVGWGRSLEGLRSGSTFLFGVSKAEAPMLLEKAISQMGYVMDDFENLSPVPFSDQIKLHQIHSTPVSVRAGSLAR